ncbi:unnamed protein product [Caenorhabditis brenneri]
MCFSEKLSREDRECIRREWRDNPLINSSHDFGRNYRISFSDTQKNFKWLYLPKDSIVSPEILLVVTSRHDNLARRNLLRKTWMRNNSDNGIGRIRSLFLIGLGRNSDMKTREIVLKEAELYDDMIVADLEDTYEGLVYKSLSLLLYAVSKVPSARMIGKIDEDVMFFPNQLISLIDQGVIETDGNNIYGYIVEAGAPASKDYGAIKASKTSYGCRKYPEFLAGPIYLMTRTAAQGVVKATKHRNFLVSEDTLITGILANDVGAKRVQLPYLHMFPEAPKDIEERILAWHTKLENDHYLRFYEDRLQKI